MIYEAAETGRFVQDAFDRAGEGKRKYPNALLVLAPDPHELGRTKEEVKRLLALRAVKGSHWERLHESDQADLQRRIQRAEQAVEERVLRTLEAPKLA